MKRFTFYECKICHANMLLFLLRIRALWMKLFALTFPKTIFIHNCEGQYIHLGKILCVNSGLWYFKYIIILFHNFSIACFLLEGGIGT